MYKILVVDDESLIREDIIYKIGVSNFPVKWIMEASDGEEALEMVKKYHPDIMLTDIKMDAMDGLELVENVNRIADDIISIIVCGYADFTFAQRALRLGVKNYLLKPVKSDELVKSLYDAVLQLRQGWKKLQALETDAESLLSSGDNGRWEKINAFINGCFCQEPEELQTLLAQGALWYQIWNVRVSAGNGKFLEDGQREVLLRRVCSMIRKIGDAQYPRCLLPIRRAEAGSGIMVLAAAAEQEEEAASRQLLELAGKVRRQVERNTEGEFFLSTSRIRDRLSTIGVLEANRAMDVRFFYNKTAAPLLCYEQLAKKTDHADFDYAITLFQKSLREGNLPVAMEAVSAVVNVCRKAPVLGLRDRYTDIVRILSRFCYRRGSSILSFVGSENMNGSVLTVFETLDEVEENLKHIVTVAMQGGIYRKENTSDLLEQVRRYADENFRESSLSTAELGKKFGISSGYLSTLFSKKYECSISKYITQKRMEYAAKLLWETTSSLENIAELCGFNSFSYFMRVFKGYYGITPAQFRSGEKF